MNQVRLNRMFLFIILSVLYQMQDKMTHAGFWLFLAVLEGVMAFLTKEE